MHTFIARVPSSIHGQYVAVGVHEISLSLNSDRGFARDWHTNVQPVIKARGRPDADWNWPLYIAPLVLFGLPHRRGRIFQLTVGKEQRPAAMIALLSRERWCLDAQKSASFLFFLSAAPPECLMMTDASGRDVSPKMIGQAALDLAVCIALNECDGRLWLHADLKGGYNLLTWYQHRGMDVVDPVKHPMLPGFTTGRANDGRYLYFDQNTALRFYNAHAHLR